MRGRSKNNKIVTVSQMFIFKWRFRCRCRRCCLSSLISYIHLYINNSLHLARKYAWIFVRGHYLFREANSFPRAKLEENCELRAYYAIRASRYIYSLRHYAASIMATIFSSETFAKRCAIFPSVRKTVNIQGFSKLWEPIKTRENCYPLWFGKY